MAAVTDLLDRVSDSTTGRPVTTTLAAPKALAAASVTITDNTNWTTVSASHYAIYEVTAAGLKDPTTQTDWKGVLTGSTISNLTLTGGTDRAYSQGAIIEETPTARYAKDLYDWGITHADQDGTLKAGAVDVSAVLADNVVSTAKIANAAITNAKLATTAGELGGEWVSYTPTLSNLTLGNGTVTAKYMRIGKTIVVHFHYLLGSTSGVTGLAKFSLPVAAAARYGTQRFNAAGSGTYHDAGATMYPCVAYIDNNTTECGIAAQISSGPYIVYESGGAPVAPATGDSYDATIVYESA